MKTENIFYIGAKGSVAAIDRSTGKEQWRTHLKGGSFVYVVLDGGVLLAHTKGVLWGLQPETGDVLWENGLEGLGFGYATIASERVSAANVMPVIGQMIADQQAAAAAAG